MRDEDTEPVTDDVGDALGRTDLLLLGVPVCDGDAVPVRDAEAVPLCDCVGVPV